MQQFQDITDKDIKNNPYAYSEEQLIYTLETYIPSLRLLNKYQKLSAYICAKYVIFGGINEDNGDCVEDTYLDTNDILNYQKHLTEDDISNAYIIINNEIEEQKLMKLNDHNVTIQ